MRFQALTLAAAASAVTLAITAPAMAVSWGTLTAYEDGVAQAKGYGNFVSQSSVYAQNNSQQYDMKPGGNAVTVKTTFYFLKTCNGTPDSWCSVGKVDSPPTTSASWQGMWTRKPLDAVSSTARGAIEVCEIQAYWNDPCSPRAIATFSY